MIPPGRAGPDDPKQKYYDLSLTVLAAKPRAQKRPPWSGVGDFSCIKSFTNPQNSFDKTWKEKVESFVKPDKVIAALTDLVADERANWMARTGAIDALERIGVPDATLQGFLDKYKDASTGDNFHVKNSTERTIKRRAEAKK